MKLADVRSRLAPKTEADLHLERRSRMVEAGARKIKADIDAGICDVEILGDEARIVRRTRRGSEAEVARRGTITFDSVVEVLKAAPRPHDSTDQVFRWLQAGAKATTIEQIVATAPRDVVVAPGSHPVVPDMNSSPAGYLDAVVAGIIAGTVRVEADPHDDRSVRVLWEQPTRWDTLRAKSVIGQAVVMIADAERGVAPGTFPDRAGRVPSSTLSVHESQYLRAARVAIHAGKLRIDHQTVEGRPKIVLKWGSYQTVSADPDHPLVARIRSVWEANAWPTTS